MNQTDQVGQVEQLLQVLQASQIDEVTTAGSIVVVAVGASHAAANQADAHSGAAAVVRSPVVEADRAVDHSETVGEAGSVHIALVGVVVLA